MNTCKTMLLLLLGLGLWAAEAPPAPAIADEPEVPDVAAFIDDVPLLHRNRVKPLRVAAREEIQAITGKSRFGPVEVGDETSEISDKHPPSSLLAGVIIDNASWTQEKWIYVPYMPLRKELGIVGQWASIPDIVHGPGFNWLRATVNRKQEADREKTKLTDWDTMEEKAMGVWRRLGQADAFLLGQTIGLTPLVVDATEAQWALSQDAAVLAGQNNFAGRQWRQGLTEVLERTDPDSDKLRVADIWVNLGDLLIEEDPLLADWPGGSALRSAVENWRDAIAAEDPERLEATTATLKDVLYSRGEAYIQWRGISAGDAAPPYPTRERITTEMTYEHSNVFTWTWIAYILGGIATAIGLSRTQSLRSWWTRSGMALTVIGLGLNTWGFILRYEVNPWGAVTNIYETVIYVAAIVALLGLLLAITTRNGLYAVAAGIGAGLCTMIGEAMPPDMGSDISTLQPVLRSRYWLFVHVKVIVASYAAFLLAWYIGNHVLFRAFFKKREVTQGESMVLYRCLQIGVVLAIAGTLLGAVWADEAWGRFWGWDPKEVWALILILVYLIPLHLRYTGVVRATGLAAWSVFGFLSVIFSWYGVNFLLGAGLHSYGFGDGGQLYVLPLCFLQILVTTALLIGIKKRSADMPPPPATTDVNTTA